MEGEGLSKAKEKVERIVEDAFRTVTGKQLARDSFVI